MSLYSIMTHHSGGAIRAVPASALTLQLNSESEDGSTSIYSCRWYTSKVSTLVPKKYGSHLALQCVAPGVKHDPSFIWISR